MLQQLQELEKSIQGEPFIIRYWFEDGSYDQWAPKGAIIAQEKHGKILNVELVEGWWDDDGYFHYPEPTPQTKLKSIPIDLTMDIAGMTHINDLDMYPEIHESQIELANQMNKTNGIENWQIFGNALIRDEYTIQPPSKKHPARVFDGACYILIQNRIYS